MENIVHDTPFEANRVWGVRGWESTPDFANYPLDSQVPPNGGVAFLTNLGSSNRKDSRP